MKARIAITAGDPAGTSETAAAWMIRVREVRAVIYGHPGTRFEPGVLSADAVARRTTPCALRLPTRSPGAWPRRHAPVNKLAFARGLLEGHTDLAGRADAQPAGGMMSGSEP